jgi:hypothetical protein
MLINAKYTIIRSVIKFMQKSYKVREEMASGFLFAFSILFLVVFGLVVC